MTATVTPEGFIALPEGVLESLGIRAGQTLEVQTEGGRLVAWKRSPLDPFEKWRGRGTLPIGKSGDEYLKLTRDGDSR